ncbi:MAG: TonB-dependent receptor, partial [Phaeodactylibacter sp.]|nr:TonB-dependent receptor [Phaeodactylibacter sp.]
TQVPTQNIRGTVVDKLTQQPLIGASILLLNADETVGTTSDENGAFLLAAVPVGRVRLSCSYIGYESQQSEDFILSSTKELVVQFELLEGINLEGVEVSASGNVNAPINTLSVVSTRSFSVEETERIAASVNDPGRMALAFPGVQQGRDDTENDIIIRGNSSFGILWRLEGIDIPNPNHFARPGTSGGGITIFSAQLMSRSDFSTGGMAAEYGNALSGAFDIHFRKGNMNEREYRTKISLLGLDFATEGPIQKGRSSYIVNYRYSTLGLLNKMGFHLVGERVSNDFQDLSFNLAFNGKDPRHKFTVFGLSGLSTEHYTPVEEPLERDPGVANHWEDRIQGSNMATLGSTYTCLINDRSYLKAVVALMGSDIFRMYDTLDLANQPFRYNTQRYLDYRLSGALSYQVKLSPIWRLKTGLIAHQVFFDFSKTTAPRSSVDDVTNAQSSISISGGGQTQVLQTYGQVSIQATEKLLLNAGLHNLNLLLNNTVALDPRFSAKLQLNPRHSLSLALGQHSQHLPLAAYFFSVQDTLADQTIVTEMPNFDLKMIRSYHGVLGYTYIGQKALKVAVEVYAQRLLRVPVEATEGSAYWMLNNQQEFPEIPVVSEGKGLNFGIDFSIEKFFSNKLYFLLTASRFESNYESYTGKTYPSKYASKWVSSYTIGREFPFKKGRTLQIGTRILYNG